MGAKLIYRYNNMICLDDAKGEFRIIYRMLKCRLKVIRDNESWHNLYTVRVRIIGRRVCQSFIREHLAMAFSGSRCRHALDCCGCPFWKTYFNDVIHTRRNEYLVLQHEFFNWLTSTDFTIEESDNDYRYIIRK